MQRPDLELAGPPLDLARADWAQVTLHYDRLIEETVGSSWLRRWSGLEDALAEAAARAQIAYFGDTQNPALQAGHLRFTSEIKPRAVERSAQLARRLIQSGFDEPDLGMVMRHLGIQEAISPKGNIPLLTEEAALVEGYTRRLGGLTVDWEAGRRIPRIGLLKFRESNLREERERAYRLGSWDCLTDDDRSEMSTLFGTLVNLRARVARNAGVEGYAEYMHRLRGRWAIARADVDRLVNHVLEVWVPMAKRQRQRLAAKLGVPVLRPWDAQAPPTKAMPEPYRDTQEIVATYERIFTRLHPRLGEQFSAMRRDGLLDLEFRPNVPPVAFNSRLHASRRAHLFISLPPTALAVTVFAHEMGHAFHFEEAAGLRLHWQRLYGSAAAELASITMQLLTLPYLAASSGGFYSDEDARSAAVLILRAAISLPLTYGSGHLYETWVYSRPDATEHERAAEWQRDGELDNTGYDMTGLDKYEAASRFLSAGPYMFPFYDVDYLIAWVGALQIWRNSKRDPNAALDSYLSALALGNTRPLPEIYATAGARLDLDRPALEDLAGFLEIEIDKQEA